MRAPLGYGRRPPYTSIRAAFVLFAACAGCAPAEVDAPEAPDYRTEASLFDVPTAALAINEADTVLAALVSTLDELGLFCGWEQVNDIVCEPGDDDCPSCTALGTPVAALRVLQQRIIEASTENEDDPSLGRIRLNDTLLRVNRACGDEGGSGSVDLFFAFNDVRVVPGVAMRATDCKLDDNTTFSGTGGFWFGLEPFRLRDIDNLAYVFFLDATYRRGGFTLPLEVLLRSSVAGDAVIEFLVPYEEGRLTAVVGTNGFLFRATNGAFICDFNTSECEAFEEQM